MSQRYSNVLRTRCIHSAKSYIRSRVYSAQAGHSGHSHTQSQLPKARLPYRDISNNVVFKSHNAFNRKAPLPVGAIKAIARLYEQQTQSSHTLNAKRNARSLVGDRIRKHAKDPQLKQAALDEAKSLKEHIAQLEAQLEEIQEQLYTLALAVPNDTHPESPIGPESAAVTISTHGPPPLSPTTTRDHVAVCQALGLLNLEAGATVTGSSWYYLVNEGALLELALVNYALSVAMKHGFTPVTTPDVVRSDIAQRCGFQPRDHHADPPVSQAYHIARHSYSTDDVDMNQSPELILSGTAEIPLAGMFANKVLPLEDLPVKLVGLGRAFRAEAGARGADTRGLYRVHQFTKLELFVVSADDQSEAMMEEIRQVQTEIFESLEFPFRVLDMPTEELGASAYRKYDAEAWMPGRGGWGEISSTSNCTDYQARRLHIRYRKVTPPAPVSSTSKSPENTSTSPVTLAFAHTLNGTAAAIPRLIVALLENGARFDDSGKVVGLNLPKVLQPFWVGDNQRNLIKWI